MLYLRIHLLIPTNCCLPIWTTLCLQIYLQKVKKKLYNVVPTNSSTIMNYELVTSDICRLVDENNQWSSTILIPQGDGFLDISSALMGDLSATLVGATKQPTVFPLESLPLSIALIQTYTKERNHGQHLRRCL